MLWSIKINSKLDLRYYQLVCTLLAAANDNDAILATIVAGGRARIQLIIEVNINKLISTLI